MAHFSALTGRKSPFADKEGAVLEMMAIDWAPALVKAAGFKPLSGAPKYLRGGIFDPEQ